MILLKLTKSSIGGLTPQGSATKRYEGRRHIGSPNRPHLDLSSSGPLLIKSCGKLPSERAGSYNHSAIGAWHLASRLLRPRARWSHQSPYPPGRPPPQWSG